MRTTVIVIGATKTISKSTRKFLSNITGKHRNQELQKTASHIWHCTLVNTADNCWWWWW